MEWVETTGKSLDQAKDLALDQLGVGADDAEFEVLEEPRTGLFGRVRGEARVRARVKPATVRPKQDRRNRRKGRESGSSDDSTASSADASTRSNGGPVLSADSAVDEDMGTTPAEPRRRSTRTRGGRGTGRAHDAGESPPSDLADDTAASVDSESAGDGMMTRNGSTPQGDNMSNEDDHRPDPGDADERNGGRAVDVDEVRAAAEEFANGLVGAFGLAGTTSATVDGSEIEVRIDGQGDGLGLLIGPAGRTLLAIQDLARVAAQRRLGDHDTRLRIDVAGYREKRRVALERFAANVAELVKESGIARSLDPMPSADRKIIHDALTEIDGVVSRSEGEDPNRRIIVSPA